MPGHGKHSVNRNRCHEVTFLLHAKGSPLRARTDEEKPLLTSKLSGKQEKTSFALQAGRAWGAGTGLPAAHQLAARCPRALQVGLCPAEPSRAQASTCHAGNASSTPGTRLFLQLQLSWGIFKAHRVRLARVSQDINTHLGLLCQGLQYFFFFFLTRGLRTGLSPSSSSKWNHKGPATPRKRHQRDPK